MSRRVFGAIVAIATVFVACDFSRHDNAGDDETGTPDGESSCTVCAGDHLQSCPTATGPDLDENCAWGCATDSAEKAHCKRVLPAGGGATVDDLDPGALGKLTDVANLSGTLDGDTGTINGVAIAGAEYVVKNNIAVFRFKSLTITGNLTLRGSRPIVLAASGAIVVGATVLAMSACDPASLEVPGPGGGVGAATAPAASAMGPGGGGGNSAGGGGGGGGGANGGAGGAGGNGTLAGVPFGDAAITMLRGGGGGGAGDGGGMYGRGGGGGGALQLISNTRITVSAGGINASGCGGGRGGGGNDDGGGGGAGGTLLLEAPVIEVNGGGLAVNGGGGGGGGGNNSTNGEPGALSRNPADGGDAGDQNGTSGGDGGAASVLTGATPGAQTNPGGGGGGVGRIRLNTRGGTATVNGMMSPGLSDPSSTATQGTAQIQ